jgi:hypothetical protein
VIGVLCLIGGSRLLRRRLLSGRRECERQHEASGEEAQAHVRSSP